MKIAKDTVVTITIQATEEELQELDSQLLRVYEEFVKARLNLSNFDKIWELKDNLALETL